MSQTKIKRSSIVQEEYKTLSPKKNILDKKRLNPPFCLYTLVLPFIVHLISIIDGYFVSIIGGYFGGTCGDGCRRLFDSISDIVIIIALLTYCFLVVLNLVLFFQGGKQNTINGIAVFCNIAMCAFFALARINSMMGGLIFLMGGFIVLILHIIIWFVMLARLQRYLRNS